MITRLFLVRHGETEWNKLGRYQGCRDIELSDKGIVQAQYLSKRFNGDFDCIYTSPLKRAAKTAEIIDINKKCNPVPVNDLKEIDFGQWEGLTREEILTKFPCEFNTWKSDRLEAPLCGGDLSIKKASIRAKDAINEIVNNHKGEKIIIVAHGGIIKAGLIGIFGWDMTMYQKTILGNTSICEIDFYDDLTPIIITLNDTSHLPQDYAAKSYIYKVL